VFLNLPEARGVLDQSRLMQDLIMGARQSIVGAPSVFVAGLVLAATHRRSPVGSESLRPTQLADALPNLS